MENKKDRIDEIQEALNDFADFVGKRRKELGMTFEELATKTNLSPSYLFRLEKGYRGSSLKNQINILVGFNWPVEKILQYLQLIIEDHESLKRISD
ncbi:helix-turn-helix transcriptional regulator [Bacillus sp. FJAT-49711]|uniref:helix-turn-helix domain-containing protein n=1 Tax=Bacillus sp. FJAT-49711 TaxID=2833585 RepID=UPI001BC92BD9|nr:helix-turn-helix transcriptional regulator [Bacillus sp. FJAT-49711]MBS4220073.1 helix-turn-helix transcriptional regulator [Bacillus sp. FJAT-49711]